MTLENLSKEELIDIIIKLQTDELTGFYKRGKLTDLSKPNYVVAMLDINNLKTTNDKLGHKEGDKLIRNVARSIRNNIRKTDIVIRYGGDEFVIIFDNCSIAQASQVASRIKYVSFGIGESTYFEKALDIADSNMYKCKKACKLSGI